MARNKPSSSPETSEWDAPVKHVDFILTGDIHLREDQPTCRTDDFLAAQARKIAWLCELQATHQVPILDAGDLFAKARPTPWLLKWAIDHLPDNGFYSVPGNHDLPEHSLANLDRSGFGVLVAARAIDDATGDIRISYGKSVHFILGIPWGGDAPTKKEKDIVLWHVMTYVGDKPWPGCKDTEARELLEMVPCRLLLTGHNHVPFVVERDGKLLVNPGSLFRTTAAQINHRPRVYLYDATANRVQAVYAPIEQGVVVRDHITSAVNKEERLSAFTSRLAENVELGLSFQANMERYLATNRVRRGVRKIIEGAVNAG